MKKTTENEIRIPTFVPETMYTYITALRAAVIEATNAAYIAERPIFHDSGRNATHYHQIVRETFHHFINTDGSPRAQLKLAEHEPPTVVHPLEETLLTQQDKENLAIYMLSLALTRALDLLSLASTSRTEKRKRAILKTLEGEIEPVLTQLEKKNLIPVFVSNDEKGNPIIWTAKIAQYRILKAHLSKNMTDRDKRITEILDSINQLDRNNPAVKQAQAIVVATIAEVRSDLGSFEQALTYLSDTPENELLRSDIYNKAKKIALKPESAGSLGQRLHFLFRN